MADETALAAEEKRGMAGGQPLSIKEQIQLLEDCFLEAKGEERQQLVLAYLRLKEAQEPAQTNRESGTDDFGEHLRSALLGGSKGPALVSDWNQAEAEAPGTIQYIHPSGARVLIRSEKLTVIRGGTPQGRRAADIVEDWLVHVGCKWADGIYQDPQVVYWLPETGRKPSRPQIGPDCTTPTRRSHP